jgi:hypothetical protein
MTELGQQQPRPEVVQVRVRLDGIIARYIGADMNLAIVDTLIGTDIGDKINGSAAAHTYNRILHTLYLDVLKDLWAITGDSTRSAASLANLKRLIANSATRQALREEYCRPPPVNFVGYGEPPLEARAIHAEEHRRTYGEQFDEIYPRIMGGIDDVLTNGRLQALERVRNDVVAHVGVETEPGKAPEIVQIDRFQIHWQAAEPVFAELAPLLTDAALIFTGKNYGSSLRYQRQHREWAAYFWDRVRKLG